MDDWRSFSIWFYSSSKEILMLRGFEESSLPNAAGQWRRCVGKSLTSSVDSSTMEYTKA
jgi:hypothetical protein